MRTTTNAPGPHCLLCAAPLDQTGYCPTCTIAMGAAAYTVADGGRYTEVQLAKAVALIAEYRIVCAIGEVHRVVGSHGETYETHAVRRTCTCRAGQHGLACYHVAAAQIVNAARVAVRQMAAA